METDLTARPAAVAANSVVNILLVDDEPRNLDVLESILSAPDYRLFRAQNAEESLLALIQNDFAAIVLDVQMPGMTGFELARVIKQRKRNQHIPVIFLTAYFHEDKDILSGYETGAVDYLTKPVNPQILNSKVKVFVDLYRTTRALAATNTVLEQEAVRRQKAEEALRQANAELEARIQERTEDLMRTNRELRIGEERYRFILENALEYAIFSLDSHGFVTSWNSGAHRIFGYEEYEIIGRRLDVIFTDEDRLRGMLDREMDRALQTGRSQAERWHLRKNGNPLWTSTVMTPLKGGNDAHIGFLKMVRDCTSQKRAEQQRLEAEALRASEQEQRRIAQDLHDGLCQQLAGVGCLVSVLQKSLEKRAAPEAATAAKISNLIEGAAVHARNLAHGLHPIPPEANGLMSALESLVSSVSYLFKVSCRFECPQPVLIEKYDTATHLYRIAQEAVTNSIRHGKARHIEVGLQATDESITLSVSDDGVGFNRNANGQRGMGLRTMEYRAGMIGGTLVVQRRTSGGTEVICAVRRSNEESPAASSTAEREREHELHSG